MIIGNGLLARSLKNYDRSGILFIAAGVSDSKCTIESEFAREKQMVEELVQSHSSEVIIFFSTYSINDPVMANSPYVKSKLELENYVLANCNKCLVVRISNLVGEGGNPKNVFNFFFNQIISGKRFSLWANSKRNLIMADDFGKILNYIIEHELEQKLNSIINIVNTKSFSVFEMVTAIEQHTGKKAVYDPVEVESVPQQVDEHSKRMFEIVGIDTTDYLKRILKKYFSKNEITDQFVR